MIGDDALPDEPSAIGIMTKNGKQKWTISIPSSYDFPLTPTQYREICSGSKELSHHLSGATHHRGYYAKDPYYMDVQEAEEQELLPPSTYLGLSKAPNLVGITEEAASSKHKVCEKSMTYVMESEDAGLGGNLMRMWLAYGLAKKEGRAFFIDESRWAYGNYTNYFALPPVPACRPPAVSQIVPCPHSARHIVVSEATQSETFGHGFVDQFEDARKMEVQRQRRIFGMMREGYEALFQLREDDARYVSDRINTLYETTYENGGISVGLHVRKGDRHPYEYQYSRDYLPIGRYIDSGAEFIAKHFQINRDSLTKRLGSLFSGYSKAKRSKTYKPLSQEAINKLLFTTKSQLVVASDDPEVYYDVEMARSTMRAQSRISLGSKKTLEEQSGKKAKSGVDQVSGWEGGFFQNVFWSLGRSKTALSTEELKSQGADVDADVRHMRELVGRSYLLDLAVLSKADAIVCAISATGCRLLGVMVGWDSIEGAGGSRAGRWHNVDGDFNWRGIDW